jgi:hypothetical protein
MFTGTPESNFKLIDIDNLRPRLGQSHNPDETEGILVEAIRSVAQQTSYVGADCMSILLPPPKYGWARVRFLPSEPAKLEVVSRAGTQSLSAAFSPWVIGGGLVQGPSVLAGGMALNLGGFRVNLEAPQPTEPGIRMVMSSISRPPEPK